MMWLTSMNKKRHQREINRLIRKINKSIEKDELWNGRFCIKQVGSPQWYIYMKIEVEPNTLCILNLLINALGATG